MIEIGGLILTSALTQLEAISLLEIVLYALVALAVMIGVHSVLMRLWAPEEAREGHDRVIES